MNSREIVGARGVLMTGKYFVQCIIFRVGILNSVV